MDWPDAAAGCDRRQCGAFDLDWPYKDQDVADFLARATPPGTVDEDALPPQLAAKRHRRGQQRTTYPTFTWRQLFTHPTWRYTPSARRALRAVIISWPTSRQSLANYANADVLEAEWDARFGQTQYSHAGAAALVWPEPNAIAAAYRSAQSARHSRLWKSDLLDAHQARVDIDGRLHQIVTTAHRLWRTHADTHLHLGPTDTYAWTRLLAAINSLTHYARTLNGRADRLIAYYEILRLDDIDDSSIRLEFGLPLEPTALDRESLSRAVEQELSSLLGRLAASVRTADVPPPLGAPE